MATECISRIGGVDDDSAIVQYLDDTVNVAASVVLFVEFQYHGIAYLLVTGIDSSAKIHHFPYKP